jgi:hypothetical protein
MKMMTGFLATAAILASAGAMAAAPTSGGDEAGHAGESAPTGQTAAPSETEPQEEKKICRTERATGSLTRRTRVCLTAAQWREVNGKTYRGVSQMQGAAAGGANPAQSN